MKTSTLVGPDAVAVGPADGLGDRVCRVARLPTGGRVS
jgi:hypothetical protein